MTYYVNEPHPTVVQNTYTHAGRGGAGNLFRAPATTPSTGPITQLSPPKSLSTGRFYSGRGGAGNVHAAVERRALSVEEEYALTVAREKAASVGHVGRGGAGNVFNGGVQVEKKDRKHSMASDASDRRDSASSDGSVRSGFFGRLNSSIRRHEH
jgi:hypothetical protein